MSYFKDLGQTVTSETRFMTSGHRKDMLRVFTDNFLQERDKQKFERHDGVRIFVYLSPVKNDQRKL